MCLNRKLQSLSLMCPISDVTLMSLRQMSNLSTENMIAVLERLDSIKDSLAKKPSIDAVDRKISDAKLAVLLGVPAIIAAGTGLYKLSMYFFL
ncbi:Uncharacterised protein [Escherichia coli]|nr:Uncharacterised protein [Escherichia coli]